MRTLPLLVVLALLVSAAGGSRRASADDQTNRNLIERGLGELAEAERLYFVGQMAGARQKAQRAARLFEQVDTQRRGDPEAAFLLVQAAVFAGDRAGARRWLDLYTARSPYGEGDANVHFARGLILLLLERRSTAALEALEQMRRVAPDARDRGRDTLYYRALVAEGERLLRGQQAAAAVPILQKAARTALGLGDRRKELAARSNVGIAWQVSGHPEEARQVFEVLAREDPKSLVWPFHLGLALAALERPGEAAAAYGQVIAGLEADRAPANLVAYLERAYLERGHARRAEAQAVDGAAERREKFLAAREDFETYARLAPRDARGHAALGITLYKDLSQPFAAMAPLERARALDPVCDAALALLIEIARRHPAPVPEGADAAEAAARWAARLRAWEADYDGNRAARARARAARAQASMDGNNGCR